jgi:hypothetical protein
VDVNHFAHQILVPEAKPWWLVVCIVAALADNLLNNGVCRTLAFPFTFKKVSILRPKKNYEKSNIFFTMQKI